jgi:4-amino-4-deoxy-L-arabinose transferase-like glycosyltransferase
MSEAMAGTATSTDTRWRDFSRLSILLLLALALRAWVIRNTEVGARDSIGFIRYALQLDQRPWPEVIHASEQHPGYAVLVWLVARPVRSLAGGITCDSMLLAAQLTSLLASLVTIFPIYFLGKTLFSRSAGFFAAALWQCLPVCLHSTTDGLSEATFLMFVSWSLYLAVAGFRNPLLWRFALSGLAGGLAYLTRPEGGEVVAAVGLVLTGYGLLTWGWRATGWRLAGLAAGAVPCLALYVSLTGHLTNKPTAQDVIDGAPRPANQAASAHFVARLPLAAFWSPEADAGRSRAWWAAQTLAREAAKSAYYFSPLLMALGLWWFRQRLKNDAGLWLLLALLAMHALLLWRMAVVIGYLSERHTLMLVLIGVFWAGAALSELGQRLERFGPSVARWAPAVLAVAVMLSCLPEALKPLHANRAGHHAAGVWLAAHGTDCDEVVDPFCWAHFYAGCVFREGKVTSPPRHGYYVVLEQTGNAHGRLPALPRAQELAARGEPVYHWPERRPTEKAMVVVYHVAPEN